MTTLMLRNWTALSALLKKIIDTEKPGLFKQDRSCPDPIGYTSNRFKKFQLLYQMVRILPSRGPSCQQPVYFDNLFSPGITAKNKKYFIDYSYCDANLRVLHGKIF